MLTLLEDGDRSKLMLLEMRKQVRTLIKEV